MHHRVTVLNTKQNIEAVAGESLMRVLRDAGIAPDAPCGGNGTCGKCTVLVDGIPVLACRTVVDRDMTVAVPEASQSVILTEGIGSTVASGQDGYLLAFDIGTTTVAGYLLDGKHGRFYDWSCAGGCHSGAELRRQHGDHCQSLSQSAFYGRRCAECAGRLLQGGMEAGSGHCPKGSAMAQQTLCADAGSGFFADAHFLYPGIQQDPLERCFGCRCVTSQPVVLCCVDRLDGIYGLVPEKQVSK